VKQGPRERRVHSHNAIDELVASRTDLLALYSRIAGHQPFNSDREIPELFKSFCEILVDYTANAHFHLYKYIEENNERRRSVREIARLNYPKISATTESIVRFNDKYDHGIDKIDLELLKMDLSALGEILADRIELEDQVVQAMKKS